MRHARGYEGMCDQAGMDAEAGSSGKDEQGGPESAAVAEPGIAQRASGAAAAAEADAEEVDEGEVQDGEDEGGEEEGNTEYGDDDDEEEEGDDEGMPSFEFRFETAKLLLELDDKTDAAVAVRTRACATMLTCERSRVRRRAPPRAAFARFVYMLPFLGPSLDESAEVALTLLLHCLIRCWRACWRRTTACRTSGTCWAWRCTRAAPSTRRTPPQTRPSASWRGGAGAARRQTRLRRRGG